MAAQNSPIKSVADLKGKAIGVNQAGSTVDAMVRYNLVQAGLQPDTDVRILTIAPGDQAAALLSGQVAAVAAPAPWPSQVAVTAKGRPLLDWKQILDGGNYLAGSLYTTKKFAQEHPEFIKKFVAANRALTDELNKDRAKGDKRVLDAWSKVSRKKLSPDVARQAFATIKYTTEAREVDIQRFADLAQKVGLARKKMDMKGFVVNTE
jgi:ABC-type nitrate/sulfonate/bicarbonate transport system substrate-binding protein